MPITGSELLAELLEKKGLGFKAASNTQEARDSALTLNRAFAERELRRDVTDLTAQRKAGFSYANDVIAPLLRRSDLVTGRKRIAGQTNSPGDVGYEIFDMSGLGDQELSELGIDLKTLSGIAANLTLGNTQEQIRLAQRQRENLLAGRPLDAPEPGGDVPQPLLDIELPGLNLALLKGAKGKTLEQIQRENPTISDVDLQKQFDTRDELLRLVEGYSKNAQFSTDPLVKAQNARARDKAMAMLGEIGYDAEAQELMKTGSQALADSPAGAVAVDDPSTPSVDESMSPANTAVFDDKISAIDIQMNALSRGMA